MIDPLAAIISLRSGFVQVVVNEQACTVPAVRFVSVD
jgi:hypothetical protein